MIIQVRDVDDNDHKQARFLALKLGISLNEFIKQAIKEKIDREAKGN